MLKEFLKNNEENLISIITIGVIIIVAIIVIITWIFNFNYSNKEVLNRFEEADYSKEMEEYYSNEITRLLNTRNIEELYKKLELSYLDKNNLNENNIKSFLLENNFIGNSISIISSSNYSSGTTYIFRFYYKNYNDYKYVNVIETKPGDYTISFEQEISDINDYSKKYTEENNSVFGEVSVADIGNDFVRYNIRITNNNVLDASIDFNDINTFLLIFDDKVIPVSGAVATNISSLTTGSSINRQLYFNVSQSELDNCTGLKIRNIQINNEFFDLFIQF